MQFLSFEMSDNANKENVKMTSRIPLTTITNQSNVFKRGLMSKGKEGLKAVPAKVQQSSKGTQTEIEYSEVSCGTSDNAAEEMISALTGGPLNETYFESLAEQRREALEITIEENEELYSEFDASFFECVNIRPKIFPGLNSLIMLHIY